MLNKTMESIDIESLDFEKYNRDIYNENNSIDKKSYFINAQKKYKNIINEFVKYYYKDKKEDNKSEEEKLKKIKKRKYEIMS